MKRKYNTPYIDVIELRGDVITMSVQSGTIGGADDNSDSGSYEDIMKDIF